MIESLDIAPNAGIIRDVTVQEDSMPVRNIPQRESEIMDSLVKSGRYKCSEDVIAAAFDLLIDFESEYGFKLQAMRAAVQEGIDAIDRGEYREFESVDELNAYLSKIADEVIEEIEAR